MPACARRLLGSSWQQQRSTARNEECGAGGTCPCESGHASALTIASSHRERRSVLPNAAAAARVATERHAERHGGSPGKASSATLTQLGVILHVRKSTMVLRTSSYGCVRPCAE